MIKAGFVGFLPTDGSDVWERFQCYADMGYRAMDMDLVYAVPYGDLAENYKRITSMGIKPLMAGVSPEILEGDNFSKKIKNLHIQNIDRVCMYSSSMTKSFIRGYGNNATYDEVMHDFEFMNMAIDMFAREGIKFCYHNHFQEFTVYYRGVCGFDLMLINVDSRLMFSPDVGWMTVAGCDPVQILKRIEGRLGNVHLKDFYDLELPKRLTNNGQDSRIGFTSLGSGLLAVDAVLAELDRQGIEYACVEQDELRNLDVIDTLRASYLRMKESGYVQ
jgi:sugar phosphate isomerase/epimerase